MATFEPMDYDPIEAPLPQGPQPARPRPYGAPLASTMLEADEQSGASVLDPRTRDLVVRTVLGAAGAESDDRQAAIASAIRNRIKSGQFGDSARRVVTDPLRFPLWRSQSGRKHMFGYEPGGPEYLRTAANVDRAFGGNEPADDARPRALALDPVTRDLIVRTVLGAAGAESDDSQTAVASAMRGRFESGQFGDNVRRVAIDPSRFPLWRSQSGRKLMFGYAPDSPEYLRGAANVDRIFSNTNNEPVGTTMHTAADPDPEQEPTFADRFQGLEVPSTAATLSPALRRAADEKLASGDAGGQFKTFVDNAANTALLNVPRNIMAYVRSRDSGRSFSDEYERLKDIEAAGSRLNPKSAIAGTVTGIGGGVLALPGFGGVAATLVRAGGAAAARRGAVLGGGYAGLEEALDSKDPIRVALAASFGGALGAVAVPMADKIIGFASQWVRSGRTVQSMVRPEGTLTDEAAAAARASGADPAPLAAAVRWWLGRK
jgi:spore germination cell wall hydrolase CwlJ-like protein